MQPHFNQFLGFARLDGFQQALSRILDLCSKPTRIERCSADAKHLGSLAQQSFHFCARCMVERLGYSAVDTVEDIRPPQTPSTMVHSVLESQYALSGLGHTHTQPTSNLKCPGEVENSLQVKRHQKFVDHQVASVPSSALKISLSNCSERYQSGLASKESKL